MNQANNLTPLPRYLQNMGLISKREGKYVIDSADNLHLIVNRLVPQKGDENYKKPFLNAVCAVNKSLEQNYIAKLLERQITVKKSYEERGWQVLEELLVLNSSWRMIVGLGGANVLETSMTLHPLYGFPYIPASAVKGIARAYAEQQDWESEKMLDLFGSEDKYAEDADNQTGKVVFFDAFPKGKVEIEVDVMNPHYGDYYKESDNPPPPGDWMDPNPVFFLTTAPNQPFCFFLAARDRDVPNNSKKLLAKAKEALTGGLTSLGAGAKTTAGYGYFHEHTAVTAEAEQPAPRTTRQPKLPKDAVVAEIIDPDKKPAIVKIVESGETTIMGGVNLAGLGLVEGSLIYVTPNRERKSKKIQSVKFHSKKEKD